MSEKPQNVPQRRYDIDWIRVIAIGLLLIYHISIGFQSWGRMIGFITSPKSLDQLWYAMSLLNIWRIPLLFFVSGMGVYFAMRKRNWMQLIAERAYRILMPYVFGIFAIVPLHILLFSYYYDMTLHYIWSSAHLWFLGNIFSYVLLLSPILFYLKKNETGKLASWIKRSLSKPWGLLIVLAAFVAEVMLVNPLPFEMYAMTWHGFFLGLLAFFFGFCFVMTGAGFWEMIKIWRWLFVVIAMGLYVLRMSQFGKVSPGYLLATESLCWILLVFAFGSIHLNKKSKTLAYLSQAAYPVYILHMVFLYLASVLIFPIPVPTIVQFILVLAFTLAGCFGTYELIRRLKFLRPLFGLKIA
ncbi:acyltransferase family protein [Algoriphagus chordae]|uniref:Acyltransferase-like protein n=1 Tax=Algoriphagus chordae TaxID=237019 RepID=A0A2W7RS84_9BACT|nr:acyltransferase family protein [Algoriphagus chordae]PZX58197.1 acyltransferase-like protein [Algoriphagus chordae]